MRLDRLLLAIIILIFAVHAAAVALSWYFLYPWIDIPLHFLGGVWTGLLFAYIFCERWSVLRTNTGILAGVILAAGFTALIGTGWEIYEYFAQIILDKATFGSSGPGRYFDTLKDLLNDILGGSLAAWWYFVVSRRRLSG